MNISLFSNFFNHHQKPLADAFNEHSEVNFRFIEMEPMPDSFKKAGYTVKKENYVLAAHENSKTYQEAIHLITSSDVVIFGSVIDKIFDQRIKANKLTFRYSERIFRKPWHIYDPRRIWHLLKHNTRFRNKQFYLLCAGGYVANDYNKVLAFPNKKLKWGYFTTVNPINMPQVLSSKPKNYLKLLFVGRLIDLKNVDHILQVGSFLKENKILFQINIIGVGPLRSHLEKLASELAIIDSVYFMGNLNNDKVLLEMQTSHLLIFSSNKEEGWGAVVNEAMANGCPIIIGNKIGSAPFLIQNGKNGLVYDTTNIDELKQQVLKCYNNARYRDKLAINAFNTISKTWSPMACTASFLKFCSSKTKEKPENGPTSAAKKTAYTWYTE